MNLNSIYSNDIPEFIQEIAHTPAMLRLDDIGMNCGCEYTSFPMFAGLEKYSRYYHSIGVALIVWHFTHDKKQSTAGLLHDISSPAFAHVIDFMHGDYLTQESTENGTQSIIENSAEIQHYLKKYGMQTAEVADYHLYPIADNDTPRLSADRLEYTIGNIVNYKLASPEKAKELYDRLFSHFSAKALPHRRQKRRRSTRNNVYRQGHRLGICKVVAAMLTHLRCRRGPLLNATTGRDIKGMHNPQNNCRKRLISWRNACHQETYEQRVLGKGMAEIQKLFDNSPHRRQS